MEEKKYSFNLKKTLHTVVIAVAAVAAVIIGLRLMGFHIISDDSYKRFSDMEKQVGKFYDMQKAANDSFLWDIDKDAQMEAVYKALFDSYGDKYTKYMTEADVKELEERVNGSFSGIGVLFRNGDSEKFEVVDVVKNGPADVAGIKPKDVITEVDGKTYKSSEEFSAAIKGKTGSQVKIKYVRDGKEYEVTVTRGEIKESTVDAGILDGNIGYVRISSFGEDTSKDFEKALAELEKKNVKSAVIDLRNNPGGLFEEGVNVADILLPECSITYTKTKKGKKETFNSDGKHTSMNYVLLVNENTASSAEVLAGAIKDNKGGPIVGKNTFGKGIVQETRIFNDKTGMTVTTRQYFSPSGNVIHGKGITPDYEVNLTAEDKEDVQLLKAISLLKQAD